MNETLKTILMVILGLAVVIVGTLGIMNLDTFFGVEHEKNKGEIRTERVKQEDKTFKNSTQYIDGMCKTLSKYKIEFEGTANTAKRKAILEAIKLEFAEFESKEISNEHLRGFLDDVMNGEVTE